MKAGLRIELEMTARANRPEGVSMEDFERMVIRAGNTVVRRESDALVIAHSKQTVASLQGPST